MTLGSGDKGSSPAYSPGAGGGGGSQLSVMASGNAHIGKPAPEFQATAVVNGAFKEVKLSDYKGEGGVEVALTGWGHNH